MKHNKYLSKVVKSLPGYFCHFKDYNALVISEDKSMLPHIFLVCEPKNPKTILMSFSVDYPFSSVAASTALSVSKIANTVIAEDFFIAKIGNTYFGEEARKFYEYETLYPLEDIDPSNTNVN